MAAPTHGDEVLDFVSTVDEQMLIDIGVALVVVLALVWLVYSVSARFALRSFARMARTRPAPWSDHVVDHKVLDRLVPIPPLLVIYAGMMWVPHIPPALVVLIQLAAATFVVVSIARSFSALASALEETYYSHTRSEAPSIKEYIRGIRAGTYSVAGLMVVILIFAQTPAQSLFYGTTLTIVGVAVVYLAARDIIHQAIAGIALAVRNRPAIGDRIEFDDGDVTGCITGFDLTGVELCSDDGTQFRVPSRRFVDTPIHIVDADNDE